MKLRILDLPRTTTEAELAALFAPYGTVKECTLVLDKATGMSKGFGFVEMAAADEGRLAISALHGSRVQKHKIRVKPV